MPHNGRIPFAKALQNLADLQALHPNHSRLASALEALQPVIEQQKFPLPNSCANPESQAKEELTRETIGLLLEVKNTRPFITFDIPIFKAIQQIYAFGIAAQPSDI